MRIHCPQCETDFEVADGQTARCTACGALVEAPSAAARPGRCPSCGAVTAPQAVICVHCGLNLKTGRWALTPADADEGEAAKAERAPFVRRAALFLMALLPGLFRPLALILALIAVAAGAGLCTLGLHLLGLGMAFSGCLTAAAGIVVHGQGVAWLIDGELTLLHEALLDFDGARWGAFLVLLVVPLSVLVAVAKLLLAC